MIGKYVGGTCGDTFISVLQHKGCNSSTTVLLPTPVSAPPALPVIIHYSRKLEEQTFDIRFFSLIRILGIWVLAGESLTNHNTWLLTKAGAPVSPGNTQNI